VSDENRGLYGKYELKRTDGRDGPGQKHERCRYFILDLTHDACARPAINAYADAVRAKNPALAYDLDHVFCTGNPGRDGHSHDGRSQDGCPVGG